MPLARIVYASILAVLSGLCYISFVYIFIPLRKKRKNIILLLCFLFSIMTYLLMNLTPTNLSFEPQYEWFYVFSEVTGIVLFALYSEENIWIGYGKMMEAALIRNLLTSAIQGGMVGMSHKVFEVSAITSFSEYQSVISTIIIYILLYLIIKLFLKWKLFGRIPPLFWEIIEITSMSLTVVDIICKLLGKSGLSMERGFLTFYIIGIIPFVSASVILFLHLKNAKQKENEKIKEMLEAQYQYYQDLRDYQMKIREFRHDLLNHVETIKYMEKNSSKESKKQQKEYLDSLFQHMSS